MLLGFLFEVIQVILFVPSKQSLSTVESPSHEPLMVPLGLALLCSAGINWRLRTNFDCFQSGSHDPSISSGSCLDLV